MDKTYFLKINGEGIKETILKFKPTKLKDNRVLKSLEI